MAAALPRDAIFSLYRSYIRQARRLPHVYLQYVNSVSSFRYTYIISRQFFLVKASQDIRTILRTSNHSGLQGRKFKRIAKVSSFTSVSVQF